MIYAAAMRFTYARESREVVVGVQAVAGRVAGAVFSRRAYAISSRYTASRHDDTISCYDIVLPRARVARYTPALLLLLRVTLRQIRQSYDYA